MKDKTITCSNILTEIEDIKDDISLIKEAIVIIFIIGCITFVLEIINLII